MKRETKRFILQELSDYVYSCEELKKLYLEMETAKKAPIGKYSNRQLTTLALRIENLERIVVAIESVSLMLNNDLHNIFVARFVEKPQKTDCEIYAALHMGKAKFYKDVHTICEMLAVKLGLK